MKTWILDEEMDAANASEMRDVITATLAVHGVKPVRPVMDDDDELTALRAEVQRLRDRVAELLPLVTASLCNRSVKWSTIRAAARAALAEGGGK